jgi:hypothetical protein
MKKMRITRRSFFFSDDLEVVEHSGCHVTGECNGAVRSSESVNDQKMSDKAKRRVKSLYKTLNEYVTETSKGRQNKPCPHHTTFQHHYSFHA